MSRTLRVQYEGATYHVMTAESGGSRISWIESNRGDMALDSGAVNVGERKKKCYFSHLRILFEDMKRQSAIFKGAFCAGVIAGLLTIAVQFASAFMNGESAVTYTFITVYSAMLWMPHKLAVYCGMQWPVGGYTGSAVSMCFVGFVNAVFGAVIGAMLVWILSSLEAETKK